MSASVPAPDTRRSLGHSVKGWFGQVSAFYGDVRAEMKKVTHPGYREVRATTGVVLVTVAFFGIFFFVVDAFLSRVIDAIISYFAR